MTLSRPKLSIYFDGSNEITGMSLYRDAPPLLNTI